MGTKTISLRDEAYARLVQARQTPDESFSEIILRARWDPATASAADYVRLVRKRGPIYPDDALDAVSKLNQADRPTPDKSARG